MKTVRVGKRTFFERFFKDPVVGLIAFFFLSFFKILPLDGASWLGEKIGVGLGKIAKKKNKIALHNLRKCFPEKTHKEHLKIIDGMWRHYGRLVGELPHKKALKKRIEYVGMENLKLAKEDGKGGFLCSAHFGNWEIAGIVTAEQDMPLHLVYRTANNPWIEKLVYQKRKDKGVVLIPKGIAGARMMIELLNKNEHIGMLCDQKMREGMWVPFFGCPAQTATAMATMALKLNVPIFPSYAVRLKGARYRCVIGGPLEYAKTGDREKDTLTIMTKVNELFEEWIRQNPEQWLWIHHRWPKEEYKKD